ncbi:MAG: mycothiol synthase [Frankia sp.]
MTWTEWRTNLTAGDAAAVGEILSAAWTVDGAPALSDQARLGLRPGSRPGHHLLARAGRDHEAGAVLGYAALELDPDEPDPAATEPAATDRAGLRGQAEIVVDPTHRRHGIGTALVEALITEVDRAANGRPGTLGVWAHGDHDDAARLAARFGFTRDRVLWQLWMNTEHLPETRYPAGVTVRAFEVGRDEDAWLRVNAAAFAHHPEQGRWSRDDLTAREAEPWFDPAGFFLAERDGDLLGFHWTKIHPGGGDDGADAGEVYVVGVRPDAAGGGLGRALTLTGVRHLAAAGIPAVLLYVDDDNRAAVRMYETIGFRKKVADVSYSKILARSPVTEL